MAHNTKKEVEEEPTEETQSEDYRKYNMDMKDCTLNFGSHCTVIINSGEPKNPPPGGGHP